MYPDEASCSNCKLEIIYQRWHTLLLRWLNLCVGSKTKIINYRCLIEIIHKYLDEICDEELERAFLCQDDIEPFLQLKYPIFRLRYLSEEKDLPKRIHLMGTMLLYHCCLNSRSGLVQKDICLKMDAVDQEMILKFCENLSSMEATINNVEMAIRASIEYTYKRRKRKIMDDISSQSRVADGKMKLVKLPKFGHNHCTCPGTPETARASTSREGRKKILKKYVSSTQKALANSSSVLTDEMSSTFSKSSTEKLNSETSYDYGMSSDQCCVSEPESLKEPFSDKGIVIYNVESQNYEKKAAQSNEDFQERNSPEQEPPAPSKELDINESAKVFDLNTDVGAEVKQPVTKVNIDDRQYKAPEEKKAEPRTIQRMSIMKSKLAIVPTKEEEESKVEECQPECACTRCSVTGPCCGGPNGTMADCDPGPSDMKRINIRSKLLSIMKKCCLIFVLFISAWAVSAFVILRYRYFKEEPVKKMETPNFYRFPRDTALDHYYGVDEETRKMTVTVYWECTQKLCHKITNLNKSTNTSLHLSLSRCTLLCTGPQLWPTPIGETQFSEVLTAMETRQMEYKFDLIAASNTVANYLSEAFKLFITDLGRLERIDKNKKHYYPDMVPKKINIRISVTEDRDPRLRLDTKESYELKIDATDIVYIKITSESFCGVRHGLETLSQLIVLDQATGYLITYSNILIKDSPTYKYRGLMIDTARNYIPAENLLRTIDAMASCKLNTFHWRISDATSFSLVVDDFPELTEYGAYSRELVYTRNDIEVIVHRAGIRGIRVLIEVAAPGPVGRAWSWSENTRCPTKGVNNTCESELCRRIKIENTVFDVLQKIYAQILNMTKVDDIFHLSNGIFSLTSCQGLINDRIGFLDKALERLKIANRGFIPKLPIIWYSPHLSQSSEAQSWERLGVQIPEPLPLSGHLSLYKVIHSSKWDLSCEIRRHRCFKYKSWQELYKWNSWRYMDAFTVEGGEAILWTDLVNPAGLDYILWPRAAAVAERLWSDIVAKKITTDVYLRLDSQRWRMISKGINVEPIWPIWCNFNPKQCVKKIREHINM